MPSKPVQCRLSNPSEHQGRRGERREVYVAKYQAHERRFGVTRVMVEPEFALTLPMGAPVRGETTLLPAEPGRWPLLLRGRPDERRADDA